MKSSDFSNNTCCCFSVPSSVVLEKIGNHNKSPTQDLPARLGGVTTPPDPSTTCNQRSSRAPTDLDSYKEITYLVNSDSESQGTSQIPNISEVIPKSSEQHFKPIHSPLSASPQTYTPPPQSLVSNHPDLEKESGDASAAEAEQKEVSSAIFYSFSAMYFIKILSCMRSISICIALQ